MFQKAALFLVFVFLGFGFYQSSDFTLIVAGVAIFMLGMIFMEGGFKAFSGGILESILKKTTNTLGKSIVSGFVSTSIVQSSSLISVIIISFLSAQLLGLKEAIGIIFGSNIGSTTTAWIIGGLGLKVKISSYALPMLVFGVVLKFTKSKSSRGIGDILLGLGLLFLGISDMKDGFDAIKENINLSQYAIGGFLGLIVYIFIGIVATVVMQSSAATMAIVIAAIASHQITYENAIALAIGANIGTTITAILGALTSNENGKRLALAHVIFNAQTGLIAVIFFYPIIYLVDYIAELIQIAQNDYALKLALFHTIFNVIGVIVMLPFVTVLINFLNKRFAKTKTQADQPIYINKAIVKIPNAALSAFLKETERLLENAYMILAHGINIHRVDIYSNKPIEKIIEASNNKLPIDINEAYQENIKSLYGEIISFGTLAQDFMNESDKKYLFRITMANRRIVQAVKDIGMIRENIDTYTYHQNSFIKAEYNFLRTMLFSAYREVYLLKKEENRDISRLQMLKVSLSEFDTAASQRVIKLIKEELITNKMATSLMNDTNYVYDICENLITAAEFLWFREHAEKELTIDKSDANGIAQSKG